MLSLLTPDGESLSDIAHVYSGERLLRFVRTDKFSFGLKDPNKDWCGEYTYLASNTSGIPDQDFVVSFNQKGKVEAYWYGSGVPSPYIIFDYDSKGKLKSYYGCERENDRNFSGYCILDYQTSQCTFYSFWTGVEDHVNKLSVKFKLNQAGLVTYADMTVDSDNHLVFNFSYDSNGRLIEEKNTINGIIPSLIVS